MSEINPNDIVGQTFGKLTVLEVAYKDETSHYHYKCRCECGGVKIARRDVLKNGGCKSCGCLRNIHHLNEHRLHKIWSSMKQRCYNEKSNHYHVYGGRGIFVCDEWKDNFLNFYEWSLNNGYSDELTIDKIDNSKEYSPENCRWTTRHQQAINRRDTRYLEYKGKLITFSVASELTGIKINTLYSRFNNGDRGERLFRPVKTKRRISYDNQKSIRKNK